MPTTLTGEVERVTFENEETSFRVIRLGSVEGEHKHKSPIAVVGTFQAVGPGTRVRVTGDFVNDARRGEQFKVSVLVPVAPDTLVGLERYLGSGIIPGIGPGFAKRIIERFGMQSLNVLDEKPERLKEVSGLGQRRVEEIQKSWASQRQVSSIMMLLSTHGASPALAVRIYERYGDKAASILQRSPYRMAMDVRGVGFKTADKIARSLGIAGDHPERAQAGVLHVLGLFTDSGHVLAQRDALVSRSAEMLEIDDGHVEAAVDALWAAGRVVVEDGAVYLARLHQQECQVAETLLELREHPAREILGLEATIARFQKDLGIELAPMQRSAIEAAAREKLVVITGGPGVGKTTIVRAVLSVFDAGRLSTRLAAPTGRAAKRMSEATGRDASTLHRLLEVEPRTGRFQRDADSPLDADAVIVDEASMIDLGLFSALLAALPKASRLVVVGDADQLPSVGPGAILRDLIDSGALPSVRLNEIFRQEGQSRIVINAHRIFRGEMPDSASADEPNADFFIVPRRDPEDARAAIEELVIRRIPRRFGLNPRDDVQVLAPMHRGPAGTQALNAALQAGLNPSGTALEHRGQTFRAGDKVMQTKNDYEREVFNGDIGVVAELDRQERRLSVRFDERLVRYEDSDLDALLLAYATSIHKSQGSEYPAVVIPLLTTHFVMLSRSLLYTAVTRARRLCVLVADPRALRLALDETRKEERQTRLCERLRAASSAGRELAG